MMNKGKMLVLLVGCVLCVCSVHSQQRIDPPRLGSATGDVSFNWSDTVLQPNINYYVRAWNWAGHGDAMDSALRINSYHNCDNNDLSSTFWRQKLPVFQQLSTKSGANPATTSNHSEFYTQSMRYHPFLTVDTTDHFKPTSGDTLGAVYGWRHKPYGTLGIGASAHKWLLAVDSSSAGRVLALDSTWRDNAISWFSDLSFNPTTADSAFYIQGNGRSNYVTIQLRAPSLLAIDTTNRNDSLLSLRLRYTLLHLHGSFTARDTIWTDTTHTVVDHLDTLWHSTTTTGYIKFDSLPNTLATAQSITGRTLTDQRGIELARDYTPARPTEFIVRRGMFSGQDTAKGITLSGYFYHDRAIATGGIYPHNPPLQPFEWQNPRGIVDYITSIDIEVYYYPYRGQSVEIDHIKLETQRSQKIYYGKYDYRIRQVVDSIVSDFRASSSHLRIARFYGVEERSYAFWGTMRYVNKLLNGLCSDENTIARNQPPSQYRHATEYKELWTANAFNFSKDCAAPFLRKADDTTAGTKVLNTFGIERGYAGSVFPDSWLGAGQPSLSVWDSTTSHYETFLTGNQWYAIDSLAKYGSAALERVGWIPDGKPYVMPWSNQVAIEAGLYSSYFKNKTMLFDGRPWWVNNWLATDGWCRFPAINNSFAMSPVYGNRPRTGEETRLLLWLPAMLGCNGQIYWFKRGSPKINSYVEYVTTGVMSPYNPIGNTDSLYLMAQRTQTEQQLIEGDNNGADWADVAENNGWYNWASVYDHTQYRWNLMNIPQDRVYLGTKSVRTELYKFNKWASVHEQELQRMRLVAWYGKGFTKMYCQTSDSSVSMYQDTVTRHFVDINHIQTRPIGRTLLGSPFYEQAAIDSGFYDLTLFRDSSRTAMDTTWYVSVTNRRTDPLWRDPLYRSGQMNFIPTSEFDTLIHCTAPRRSWLDAAQHDSSWWQQKYWAKQGCREITIPFCYSNVGIPEQTRFLHIQEIVTDSTSPHIDTVLCASCALSVNYQPAESKLYRVTVLRPKDSYVSSGSLDFCNQRKIVAMPILTGTVAHRGIYDSTHVRYHIVYHRIDTLITGLHDTTIVPRVYYKRTKAIDRCTPQDINPLDPNISDLWDVTRCLSDSIKEFYLGCTRDSMMYNKPCKYPSLVVRFDSVDNEEYVYVVFNCQEPHPTHPLHSFVVESQFVSHDTVGSHASRVISRFGILGDDDIDTYGHATINASRLHNYYAWSSASDGISIASRLPSLSDTVRCPSSPSWSFSRVSWNSPRLGGMGIEWGDCRHPSLNTYARMDGEDSCALVWEESRHHTDTAKPFDNWNIYYTHLSMRSGVLTSSLPPFKGGDPAVLDTNASGNIFRVSKWITNRRGFSEYHLPSVVRNLSVREPSWRADVIAWEGQGAYTYVCGTTPSDAHGIFMIPMWTDRDTLFYVGNHSIWSCYFQLRRPSLTWSTSFTQDSDVVIDFNCPADGWVYGTDMIFNFGKRYWSFTAPMNIIAGGNSPHLSAQPIIGTNTQWKQMRRLFNTPGASVNPAINSSVQALFKGTTSQAPYAAYPLVGFENSGGLFTICDLIDDGRTSTMHALYRGRDHQASNPSDTVFSDWFAVNDKKSLHFVMNGQYTDIAMMFLENHRTGVSTYVDLDQIVIDSSREVHLGTFTVTNGGGDEYKILLTKRDTSARYIENVYIDNRLPYYGKSSSRGAEESAYEVDLGASCGLSAGQSLSVYPIPAEDEVFIAVPHQSRQGEASGNMLTIVVTDATGEIVRQMDTKGGETLKVSCQSLASGVYSAYVLDASASTLTPARVAAKFVVSR